LHKPDQLGGLLTTDLGSAARRLHIMAAGSINLRRKIVRAASIRFAAIASPTLIISIRSKAIANNDSHNARLLIGESVKFEI